MSTCPQCHGKDGLHGLDCGFGSVGPHITHYDGCGCLSARYTARIDALEATVERLKARCCQTCCKWPECFIQDSSISEWGDVRPADFACNRWAERGTE